MKLIEKQINNRTNEILIVSHIFNGFENVVCSGSKIYQLPCQIGKKSFKIKELKPKYHQGSIVYIINSKRVNSKTLKAVSIKVKKEIIINSDENCPF